MSSERIAVTDDVTIAAQPTKEQLRELAAAGYRSVINVRHTGEDQMPLSPDEEGEFASRAGLAYAHVPFSLPEADRELVERFRQQLAGAPKPALVHCKLGQRAGALVMMDQAAKEGLTGDEALERARELGTPIENPKLAAFVRSYLDGE